MPTEYPKRSTDPIRPSLKVVESPKSGSVMIARIVGILCVAGGFILGIQGLEQPDSPLLPTALGMIIAGLVAQIFALARSWYLYSQRNI
jgi:drug/metabolite transporter (DMT)-like permease